MGNSKYKDCLSAIRAKLEGHKKTVDRAAKKIYDNVEKAKATTKEDYLTKVLIPQWTIDAKSAVSVSQFTTKSAIQVEFDSLKDYLTAWTMQPLPEDFAAVVGVAARYGIKFTPTELKALDHMSRGNYLSRRIVNGIANETKVLLPDFRNIDEVLTDVGKAQRDCELFINSYCGEFSTRAKRYEADFLMEELPPHHVRYFASAFLGRDDSSLAILEKNLSDDTSSLADLGLLPEMRDRIDKYFEGAEPDKKIDICINLLENNSDLAGFIRLYDAELFNKAVLRKEETAMQRAAEATQKMLEAQEEAEAEKQAAARSLAQAAV